VKLFDRLSLEDTELAAELIWLIIEEVIEDSRGEIAEERDEDLEDALEPVPLREAVREVTPMGKEDARDDASLEREDAIELGRSVAVEMALSMADVVVSITLLWPCKFVR